jgi:hypothetical protein
MISARIPFAGFYHSIWDQEIDQWLENQADWHQTLGDREIIWNAIYDNTDFSAARLAIAQAYFKHFVWWLGDSLELPVEGEFEALTSPRYYNFSTDKIFALLPESVLQAVLDELRSKDNETLVGTFADMFTSRDGFASFYDPQVPSKPIEEWDHNELYALLCAWVRFQAVDDIDFELFDNMGEAVSAACDAACDWAETGLQDELA